MRADKARERRVKTARLVSVLGVTIVIAVLLGWGLSEAQHVKRDWNQFFTTGLRPVEESVILPVLVGLLVLMVLARWSVLFGGYEFFLPLPRTKTRRTREGRLGLATAAISLAALGALAVGHTSEVPYWSSAAMAVLSGVASIHLLARWWASGRAIQVEAAKGNDADKAAAGQVVALLKELGSNDPQDIKLAQGPEVTALSESGLASTPTSALATAALHLVNALLPRAIWRAIIDAEDDDRMTVTVLRNGEVKNTATIDRGALGLDVPLPSRGNPGLDGQGQPNGEKGKVSYPDLHKMAAAVMLTELVKAYDDIEGPEGSTNWISVGLHNIASNDFWGHPDQRLLLARAIENDPSNRRAQAAFHSVLGQSLTDVDGYIDWMKKEIKRVNAEIKKMERSDADDDFTIKVRLEESAYRRRLKLDLAVTSINACYLAPPEGGNYKELWSFAASVTADLVADLFEQEPKLPWADGKPNSDQRITDEDECLAVTIWLHVASMYLTAKEHTGDITSGKTYLKEAHACLDDENYALGMETTYNRACYYADKPEKHNKAIRLLRLSDEVPSLKWARALDPQLSDLRRTPDYRRVFLDDPHKNLSSLKPFSGYQEKLADAGLEDPAEFSNLAKAEPDSVARLLGTDILVVRHLSGIADLALRLRANATGSLDACADCYLDICQALVDEGYERWRDHWPEDLPAKLDESLMARLKTSPDAQELARLLSILTPSQSWWRLVKERLKSHVATPRGVPNHLVRPS